MNAKEETSRIRPEGCICDPFDLAAMGHMTNCPCYMEDVKAPAPDHIMDLHQRCATIIRKAYFLHTRNEQKAHETAMLVLEEVHRTYEQIAAGAAAEEQEPN